MNRLIACTLALLVVLLTPASANSAPTRLGGTGGSADGGRGLPSLSPPSSSPLMSAERETQMA